MPASLKNRRFMELAMSGMHLPLSFANLYAISRLHSPQRSRCFPVRLFELG
jgi:hypothetical protein